LNLAALSSLTVFSLLRDADFLFSEYALNAVNQGVTALGIKGMLLFSFEDRSRSGIDVL
jgi:hypothetical protein